MSQDLSLMTVLEDTAEIVEISNPCELWGRLMAADFDSGMYSLKENDVVGCKALPDRSQWLIGWRIQEGGFAP